MRKFILCCLIVCLLKQGMMFIISNSSLYTTTQCYGPGKAMSAACSDGRIFVRGFYYGFKLNSANCSTYDTCCQYDSSKDCLERSITMPDLSGHEDGYMTTSSIARKSCNSSYSATSTYNRLDYLCVDSNRISEMCTDVSSTGKELYLWNRGYPNTGILAEDKSCTCSIEVFSPTVDQYIDLYILHMDLYEDHTNCLQTLTSSFLNGSVSYKYQCRNLTVGVHQGGLVVNSTLTLDNAHTASGGRFWIGFKAPERGIVTISCSASTVKGCGNPTYGVYSTVTTSSTVYGSIATYTCLDNFVYKSGNLRRHCLQNGQWNGTALTCINHCGTPASGYYSEVISIIRSPSTVYSFVAEYNCIDDYVFVFGDTHRYCKEDGQWNGTSLVCAEAGTGTTGPGIWPVVGAVFGALAVGVLVGATGLFVCRRLRKHRALPTNHEMVQTGTRRPDVSDGQSNLGAIDCSTSEVHERREYHTLEFDNMKPDHTYATLSA